MTGDDDVYGGARTSPNWAVGIIGGLRIFVGDTNYFSSSAQGGGGQYIILVEDLDLMVVVTAHDNDNQTLKLIGERVIPAFL